MQNKHVRYQNGSIRYTSNGWIEVNSSIENDESMIIPVMGIVLSIIGIVLVVGLVIL